MMDLRFHDDVVIVEPTERLTAETEAEFTAVIRELVDAGWVRLVVSLADVPRVDSMGLGALAHAYTSAWLRGGDLKLLHVTPRNRHVLTITRLATVFEVFDSEVAAVRSFGDQSRREKQASMVAAAVR